MAKLFFDTGFNEGTIKGKVISQMEKMWRKKKKKMVFLQRVGNKSLDS
jgi:hypothetical protein